VRFVPSGPFDEGLLTRLPGVTRVERGGRHVVVTGTGELVNVVVLALHAAGVDARDVQLDAASLQDAYVRLTGERDHPQGGPS
jgi:ABC-2 type transport system ATP-binding protein